jgi:hypothetical protein
MFYQVCPTSGEFITCLQKIKLALKRIHQSATYLEQFCCLHFQNIDLEKPCSAFSGKKIFNTVYY